MAKDRIENEIKSMQSTAALEFKQVAIKITAENPKMAKMNNTYSRMLKLSGSNAIEPTNDIIPE